MIRSRDFLLYVVALLALVFGAGTTAALDIWDEQHDTAASVLRALDTVEGASVSGAVLPPFPETDRVQRLAILREQIAAGAGIDPSRPPASTVFSGSAERDSLTEESLAGADFALTDDEKLESDRAPQYCGGTPTRVSGNEWPNSARLIGGAGKPLVQVTETVSVVVGTTTEDRTTTRTLLQLPTFSPATNPHCLPYDVVGVTLQGQPITNHDAWRYRNTVAGQPIGYALDGAVILGATVADETLDACGGAGGTGDYHYVLRPNEPFVLSCFTGEPAELSLPQ